MLFRSDLNLPVPDFSTLSRRAIVLSVADDGLRSSGPITLIVDSTGLKIHRGSGWQEVKHGAGKTRKSWRKLHIGYDPVSGEIVASLLTADQVGDETALPELVAGMDGSVTRFLADGAYDGTRVSNCLLVRRSSGYCYCLFYKLNHLRKVLRLVLAFKDPSR